MAWRGVTPKKPPTRRRKPQSGFGSHGIGICRAADTVRSK